MTKRDPRDAFDMTPIIKNYPEAERKEGESKKARQEKADENVGFTGGTQEKSRTGTEDAQKRSDTGAGL